MLSLSLCLIVHDRPAELREALNSAVTEAWDEVLVLDMASDPPVEPISGVTWLRSETNAGVTAGRNRLLASTTADVVVFLDDDAVFTSAISAPLRHHFADRPDLAVVAFRVQRPGGAMASSEYPFRGPARDNPAPRECAYFVGAAYAVRRSAVMEVGGYDDAFLYSTEEVDLALRLMKRGWHLLYDPALTVEHRPSSRGRSISPRVPALRLRNRIALVRRHLPVGAALIHLTAWGLRTLSEARAAGNLHLWLSSWAEGFRLPIERDPLSWRAVARVHRLGGRALW